jgi:hypothetical protein
MPHIDLKLWMRSDHGPRVCSALPTIQFPLGIPTCTCISHDNLLHSGGILRQGGSGRGDLSEDLYEFREDEARAFQKGRRMVPAMVSVAVVGSGISGLLCAQSLLQQAPGISVSVFEWGRGPGGRTARRRITVNGTQASFDHAAPFFGVASGSFRAGALRDWQARGLVSPWAGRFATFDAAPGKPPAPVADPSERWLGVPTMHTICRALSDDVLASGGTLLFGRHVLSTSFSSETRRWRVTANNRFAEEALRTEVTDFDALVLSDKLLVLPNIYSVLSESDRGPLSLPPLSSKGCVVLLIALDRAKLPTDGTCPDDWDVLEARGPEGGGHDAPVRLLIHESKKPQRDSPDELDLWVV